MCRTGIRANISTVKTPRLVAVPVALTLAVVAAGCAKEPKIPEHCPDQSSVGSGTAIAAAGGPISVASDSTLPAIRLADLAKREFPTSGPVDDHGITLGGTGSDIFPAQAPDEYWMITDRGPNGQVKGSDGKVRTFPVPTFDPSLLRVKLSGSTVNVEQIIPITTTDGRPVTGVSNLADHDEAPYDLRGDQKISYNQAGLDPEGMVHTANGEFWVSEEYAPSVLHLSPTGTVLARYVPEGIALPDAGYPVFPTLPAILAKRQGNRGFESLAITPDGGTLYAMLQSPLALPDETEGGKSRAVRLLAISSQTGKPTAEYVYPLDDVNRFDPSAKGDESEMKISGMAWYGPDQLLVDERTDEVTKLYVARIDQTSNILGGPFDDAGHTPPLEQADLATTKPMTKTALADLTGLIQGVPKKIEGVAVRDPNTLVVANDNDFGMVDGGKAFDVAGGQCSSEIPSRVVVLHLNPIRQ
jgi:hypothetical protein